MARLDLFPTSTALFLALSEEDARAADARLEPLLEAPHAETVALAHVELTRAFLAERGLDWGQLEAKLGLRPGMFGQLKGFASEER